jgi:hypothetical protein
MEFLTGIKIGEGPGTGANIQIEGMTGMGSAILRRGSMKEGKREESTTRTIVGAEAEARTERVKRKATAEAIPEAIAMLLTAEVTVARLTQTPEGMAMQAITSTR